MEKDIPRTLASTNRYKVRLAESTTDLQAAQSLRYRVFNLEMGEGLDESHTQELDADKYDPQCDHLLVIEQKTDTVIGTYRMQTYEKARQHHGFYTDDEFELATLPTDLFYQSVEVGRACIAKDHRNGRVLYLLWRGIAEYMKLTGSRYLFGCCSISSTTPRDGWIVMDYLRNNDFVHQSYYLDTHDPFSCPETSRAEDAWRSVQLPQLFDLYLDLGAKVLSKPALDTNFKTIDFLIIVDIEQLDERSRALFLK